MFDHEDLRAFVEVARSGTFTAAAKALITTQPSLSRRVARLEESIGAPLFDRDVRGPRLTPLGQTLLPYAVDLMAQAEAFAELARTHADSDAEELVVAVSEPLAGACLPQLARHIEQMPELHLRILELPPNKFGAVPNTLLQYQAELGLVSRELVESVSFPAIDGVTFGVVPHYAAGLPALLGHSCKAIEWEELATFPLLLPVSATGVAYPIPRAMPTIRHEGGSSGLLLAMARAGLGIAILGGEHHDDQLVERPVEVLGKPQRSEVHLIWRRHGTLSSGAKRIVSTVRARVAHAGLPLLGQRTTVRS